MCLLLQLSPTLTQLLPDLADMHIPNNSTSHDIPSPAVFIFLAVLLSLTFLIILTSILYVCKDYVYKCYIPYFNTSTNRLDSSSSPAARMSSITSSSTTTMRSRTCSNRYKQYGSTSQTAVENRDIQPRRREGRINGPAVETLPRTVPAASTNYLTGQKTTASRNTHSLDVMIAQGLALQIPDRIDHSLEREDLFPLSPAYEVN